MWMRVRHGWKIVLAAIAIAGVGATAAFFVLRPSSDQQQALSWSTLRGATYPSEFPRSRQAPLKDGVYEEEVAPGSATRLRILLADIVGFGNIDDDDSVDAAAVLISSPGG